MKPFADQAAGRICQVLISRQECGSRVPGPLETLIYLLEFRLHPFIPLFVPSEPDIYDSAVISDVDSPSSITPPLPIVSSGEAVGDFQLPLSLTGFTAGMGTVGIGWRYIPNTFKMVTELYTMPE